MKAQSEVAKRYARALYEAVGETQAEDALRQLRSAQEILGQPKLKELLISPVLSRREKELVVDQSVSDIKLSQETLNFLRLLAAKDRINNLDEIVAGFETINDEKNNVLRGTVTSPQKLTDEEKEEIENVISKFTGNQLLLEYEEDPALVGGILAKVGSYTFDGTIETQLTKLKEQVNRVNQ